MTKFIVSATVFYTSPSQPRQGRVNVPITAGTAARAVAQLRERLDQQVAAGHLSGYTAPVARKA